MANKKRKRYRLKKSVKQTLLLLAVLISVSLIAFGLYRYFYRGYSIEDANIAMAFDIPVNQAIVSDFSKNRPMIIREIKYIVIHETDNISPSADAKNHADYLLSAEEVNSWHYTVDENTIYHHIPDHEVAWHAGDQLTKNGGNLNGVGIEMCVNEGSSYTQTLDNTAKLVATLLHAYNLDVDDVRKHQHFSGKLCPAGLLEEEDWNAFLEDISNYYNLY